MKSKEREFSDEIFFMDNTVSNFSFGSFDVLSVYKVLSEGFDKFLDTRSEKWSFHSQLIDAT